MKILLISDAHANRIALEAIERAEKNFDQVLFAGDHVDYGFQPEETVQWMREHNAISVRGNHDNHVLSLTKEDCALALEERHFTWAHLCRMKMSEDAINYLHALPEMQIITLDSICYQMQHMYGSDYAAIQSVNQFERFWQGKSTLLRRMIFGHSHRRCIHQLDNAIEWLNPGSVSYRHGDDLDKRAHYMVIQDGVVRFGAVEYDTRPFLRETIKWHLKHVMNLIELQNAYFFFGSAATDREALLTDEEAQEILRRINDEIGC